MSLQCQKIEIKKLPFYASDITNFTSAVCAVVTEMSSFGEPLFESWAATYSGDLYDTFTTVSTYSSFWQQTDDYNVNTFVYSNSANILQSNSVVNNTSANWNSVYNSYNTSSASFLTNSSADIRYVKLSGDVMTGGLSSPSLSTNNLYVAGSTINFFDGTGSVIETLKSNDVGNFKSNYTLTNSRSGKWEETYSNFSTQSGNNTSVYNTVQTNSGNWNYQGTDLKSLTSNWENTYTNFSLQSSNNLSVYNSFNSNSSNYNSVYNTVNSNSSTNWNYQGNDIKSLTGNWQNTYIGFSSQSGNNASVYSTVNSNSATNWNYQGNDIKSLTANWQASYTALTSSSANWNDTRNTVQTNSATLWNYQGTDLKSLSSNWQNTYIGFSSQSANNLSVYSNVNTNSGNWNYQGTDIKALTSNWENTYSNFSVQSANNLSVYNSINANSANWDSVYTDVSNTSGSWNDTTTSVQTNSSFWEYYDYSYKGSYRYSTSDAPFYDVKNVVINDQQVYDNLSNPLNTPDGNLYLCIKTLPNPYGYPAPVDENGTPQTEYWKLLEVDSVLARTANSVYNTVQTNSATWGSGSSPQTLSFNESNAELTISDGNTVSLSSLNVSYLSALYDVSIPSPVDGQVLIYSSLLDKWTNGCPSSASGATGYYGSFYDTTSAQSVTVTTSSYNVALGSTFESNGVSLSGNRIFFQYAGTYEIIYSIQFSNPGNSQQDIDVWFQKNGVNLADSNSVFTVPQKENNNINGKLIAVTPLIITLNAGDSIGLLWNSPVTDVEIITIPTQVSPEVPQSPAVILTVKQVTNVQVPGTVTGNYLPLSGGTLTGAVSTTDIFYTNGGNSTQWNSSYNTVNSNSATWGTGGGSGGGGVLYYFNQAILAQEPTTNIPLTAHQLGRLGLSSQTTYESPILSQASYSLVAGFLTDVLNPNIDAIPGGLWDFNIWGFSNANVNNPTVLQALVYTYDGINAPFLLSTSDDTTLTDTGIFIQHEMSCLVPQTSAALSTRIYVEFRAKASAANKTVTLAFGDSTPSHIHTTLPSVGGTGLVKVIDGVTQSPASLLVDADVSATANISQSKINGLTDLADKTNSTYNTVNSYSATTWNYQGTDIKSLTSNWENTYTTFSTQSANNLSVYSIVQTNSSTTWNYQGTDLKSLTSNWQDTYINFSSQSANNLSVYATVNSYSATTWNPAGNYLPLSGGLITGNLNIFGNLSCNGTQTFNNTIFSTTSAVSVVHVGDGPALWVGNNGTGDIASFYDIDANVEILHVGGNNGTFPNVGVKTSTPNVDFTVNGEISASSVIYDSSGNSNQWNNVYSTVQTNSGSWGGGGGSFVVEDANTIIGLSMFL